MSDFYLRPHNQYMLLECIKFELIEMCWHNTSEVVKSSQTGWQHQSAQSIQVVNFANGQQFVPITATVTLIFRIIKQSFKSRVGW